MYYEIKIHGSHSSRSPLCQVASVLTHSLWIGSISCLMTKQCGARWQACVQLPTSLKVEVSGRVLSQLGNLLEIQWQQSVGIQSMACLKTWWTSRKAQSCAVLPPCGQEETGIVQWLMIKLECPAWVFGQETKVNVFVMWKIVTVRLNCCLSDCP